MTLTTFALASAEWGVARFTTDVIALSSLVILVALPFKLLSSKVNTRSPWADGNALSKKSN